MAYVLKPNYVNSLLTLLISSLTVSGCMFFFGICTLCQGFVHNYSGILAVRFFLGVCEASMFPACFYILGSYYKRREAQKRFSFFFSSTSFAGAFSGLLAAAIGKLDGKAGYEGWRWIFIIEGTVTAVVAILFFWFLPDFPEDAKWLTDDEKKYVAARLRVEQGRSAIERKITAKDVGNVFKDFKVLLGGFMYFGLIVPAYGQ